jgi:Peptidase family M28
MMGRLIRLLLAVLVIGVLAVGGAVWYSLGTAGRSYEGPLPALSAPERDLTQRLRAHVEAIASEPHNVKYPAALERSARYIEQVLKRYGHAVEAQVYEVDGQAVRNIAVTINASRTKPRRRTVVVGAHYDSWLDAPGANDNGSGTAAVLELARGLAKIETTDTNVILVLFVNEEPPYFKTPDMGSVRFAKMLADRKEPVAAMLSLETIGYFTDQKDSQRYPVPFDKVFPTTGNFVSFVALPGSRDLMHQVIATFRATTKFPSIGGVAPGHFAGIDWSDHWAFTELGYQALMITDTAVFRYPHYHKSTDTPDKIDYERLARVTKGVERAIQELVGDVAR